MGVTLDGCLEPSYVLGSNHAVTESRSEWLLTSPLHSHSGPCLSLQYSQCVPQQTLPCLSPLRTFVIVPGEEVGGRTGPGKQNQCNSENALRTTAPSAVGWLPSDILLGNKTKRNQSLNFFPQGQLFFCQELRKDLFPVASATGLVFAMSSSDL